MKIHPAGYVDCGACEPVCTVEALYYEDDVRGHWSTFTADNTALCAELLFEFRSAQASRGGAAKVDALGDVPALVAPHQAGDS
jgi:ferredoxin